MNDSNFLKEIGRSYIVSSLLPSALFISLASILFRGFIPRAFILGITEQTILFGKEWVLGLIFLFWVAFYLFSSVDWTVKFFEGYYLPASIKESLETLFRFFHFESASPSYREVARLLEKKERTKQEDRNIADKRGKALEELQGLELISPIDAKYLLPTRLGNVLRASEIYAFERYCIEGITIWPRLFNVLPSPFTKNLEEKNNHLLFLLNSSLLVYVNAAFCLIAGVSGLVYQAVSGSSLGTIPPDQQTFFVRGFSLIMPIEYVFLSVLFIGFGYALYTVAVNAAIDYALFIRSGFDLYRMDLLKQLRQPLPANLSEEKQTWLTLTEYFISANRLGALEINFPYVHYSDNEKKAPATKAEAEETP